MAMKIFLLLCVVVTQGHVVIKREVDLPKPQITRITAFDPQSFEIVWEKVSGDVSGYKVKVWELPTKHTLHYDVVNGDKVFVEDGKPRPKFPPLHVVPQNKPQIYTVSAKDDPKLIVRDIKLHTTYETRVQAYNDQGDGPISGPMRIHLQ